MPRKLVVYSIPDDFDPATHVALGPWCFYQREDVFPDWDELTFCDAFDDPDVRAAMADAAIHTANGLLDELWPEMNRLHGCDHDRAFWHTVLMNWLMHLVMLSWRLWAQTALFIRRHGDEPFEVAVEGRGRPFQFAQTLDFIMAVFGDSPFRRWLASEVVRRQAPSHWTLVESATLDAARPDLPQIPPPKPWQPIGHINGLGSFWTHALATYLKLLPPRASYKRPRNEPTGFPPAVPPGLLALLRELVAETLPLTLGDGFANLCKSVGNVTFKPGRLHISAPSYHSDPSNLLLAMAAESGERIVMSQHGGTYGWARTISMTGELEYVHDTFLTWGWTRHDGYQGRFVPLPPPLIGRRVGQHRFQDDRMILVGAAMYGFNPRIDNYPDPVAYRKRKRQFIDALPAPLRGKLAYRAYRDDKCFADDGYLRRFYPDLATVDGDLSQAMLRAKLVVQDHHSTTLSITLGANIPTIGIWDERAWPLGGDGKILFDRLRKAGIAFDDPAEAARHIQRIWDNVEGWWSSREVQDARKAWTARFGWGTRWWWLHWLLRLPRL
jgi:hypothetical protein